MFPIEKTSISFELVGCYATTIKKLVDYSIAKIKEDLIVSKENMELNNYQTQWNTFCILKTIFSQNLRKFEDQFKKLRIELISNLKSITKKEEGQTELLVRYFEIKNDTRRDFFNEEDFYKNKKELIRLEHNFLKKISIEKTKLKNYIKTANIEQPTKFQIDLSSCTLLLIRYLYRFR